MPEWQVKRMTFKESLEYDNDAFLDSDVFAEIHELEGQECTCVIDTDILSDESNHNLGKGAIRVFVKTEDIPIPSLEHGDVLNVDGTEYLVDTWAKEQGMTVITLYRNEVY